jgi:prepilin-type N-terminal cleavage/methylation domain-containing protein
MKNKNLDKSGFTLLELLLVIGILVVIAGISTDFYGNFVSSVQLEDNAKTIIYDLRNTRDKAMNGQNDLNWGIHFVDSVNDYYEIFPTSNGYSERVLSQVTTNYLNNGISLQTVPSDIIFSKISGWASSTSVTIKAGLATRTISIQEQGLIN